MDILRIPKSSRDATDLLTDAHWNPVQRSDMYSTKASTSEYDQYEDFMSSWRNVLQS